MIIVKLQGGLGNQMFQYAAAKSLALKKDVTLFFDTSALNTTGKNIIERQFELHHFKIAEKVATPAQLTKFLKPSFLKRIYNKFQPYYKKSVYAEPHFHLDKNFFKVPDNTLLTGYWQSENYFKNISGIIRNDFTITAALSEKTKFIAKEIFANNSLSLHVRRGDYVSNIETQKLHGNCSLDYYEKAFSTIVDKTGVTNVYVFSDDIAWTRENLKFTIPANYIDHNTGDHAYEDLFLMSQCKHNIIANSSFSWWGAWLNSNPDKIVVAPKNWFGEFSADTKDLHPPDWIII